MIDLLLTQDGAAACDLALVDGDIAIDQQGQSAAMISLLADARAADDDELPDASNDQRGWWADALEDVPVCSLLWLVGRNKRLEATRQDIEQRAGDALAWMVAAGMVASVHVSAVAAGRGYELDIKLDQSALQVNLAEL